MELLKYISLKGLLKYFFQRDSLGIFLKGQIFLLKYLFKYFFKGIVKIFLLKGLFKYFS